MKTYQCHKRVTAAQIEAVAKHDDGTCSIKIDGRWAICGKGMIARYTPEAGDYLVEYEDGYQSFSPKKAFEDGYTAVEVEPDNQRPLLAFLSALSEVRVRLDAMSVMNPRARALVLTKLDEARLWAVDGENG